jgi:hypothetical protein
VSSHLEDPQIIPPVRWGGELQLALGTGGEGRGLLTVDLFAQPDRRTITLIFALLLKSLTVKSNFVSDCSLELNDQSQLLTIE